MLAYIPQNMSRKRSVPFRARAGDYGKPPLPKRTRTTVGGSAGKRESDREGETHSLDVFVLPRAPRSRRVASLKAQIANTSLLIAEHRQRHSRSSSPQDFTATTGKGEGSVDVLIDSEWGGPSLMSHGSQRSLLFQEKISQPLRRESGKSDQVESCGSSLSPLSSMGSEWEEEKVTESVKATKVKNPALNTVSVVEKTQSAVKQRVTKSSGATKRSPVPTSVLGQGYVRRLASLNARACVSAMLDSGRPPYKRKSGPNTTTKSSTTVKTPQSPIAKPQQLFSAGEESESVPQSPVDVAQSSEHQANTDKDSAVDSSLLSPFLGKGPGYVVLCASPNTLTRCGIIRGSSDPVFNSEGLLWNGDTVHPQARVYLTPEGEVPHLIVPPICPARPHCLSETKNLARAHQSMRLKRRKAVKGDNGWYAVGNPIKEILLPQKDGASISRKYFAGIRRKNEELCVRDCITVKSGKRKQDRPYIAKIGSIWKENNGPVNVTLFWYYRPEEAIGISTTDFQEDELLASQHYDDNSVACIEDKCYVLGLRQYCRYHAQCRSVAEGIGTLDSFSVIRTDPYETGQTVKRKKMTCHVFLCHRGYNHIAGRLLKSHK